MQWIVICYYLTKVGKIIFKMWQSFIRYKNFYSLAKDLMYYQNSYILFYHHKPQWWKNDTERTTLDCNKKRQYEKQKLEKQLEQLKTNVRSLVTGIEWYIIYLSIDTNVCKKRKTILPIQEINWKTHPLIKLHLSPVIK